MVNLIYEKIDPEEYEKRYSRIPREIYLRQYWLPIISSAIKRFCVAKKVLDLGCGYGKYIGIIKNEAKEVVALDSCERWVNFAKLKYPDVKFILGSAYEINLKSDFDVVLSVGLFEYGDKDMFLKQIRKILVQDGFAIILTPNKYSLSRLPVKIYYKIFRKNYVTIEASFVQMKNLFVKNGFELVEYRMDDGLIWLPNFLDRLFGLKVYHFIEKMVKLFNKNPLSANMFFIIKKINYE